MYLHTDNPMVCQCLVVSSSETSLWSDYLENLILFSSLDPQVIIPLADGPTNQLLLPSSEYHSNTSYRHDPRISFVTYHLGSCNVSSHSSSSIAINMHTMSYY